MRFKPYKVEYAKSGGSKCKKKKCEVPIVKDQLRMSIRNRKSEHPQENWHHYDCFWTKIADPKIGESLFDGIEHLRPPDQERIQNDMKINGVKYRVDYAKTARSKCKNCQTLIEKGDLRMSKQMPSKYHEGLDDNWYHFECFWGILSDTVDERTFHGIKDLQKEDAEKVHNRIKSIQEKFERKKRKSDEEIIPPKKPKEDLDSQELEKLKVQAEHLCDVVDYFKNHLKPDQIRKLLNDNEIPGSVRKTDTINDLADCAVFGVPITNHQCVDGFLFYSTADNCYKCRGRTSDYDPCCFYRTDFPGRKPFLISDDLKKAHNFLAQLPKLPYRQISKKLKMNRTSMENSQTPSTSRAASQVKSNDETVKLSIKNGCAVDPAMDNAEDWHVYMDNEGHLWEANLNHRRYKHQSFYKIQLLKHDINKDKYVVFTSWGTLGSNNCKDKKSNYTDLDLAQNEFKNIFLEKTNNKWEDRENFKKYPDIGNKKHYYWNKKDYGNKSSTAIDKDDFKITKLDINASQSQLSMPIKEVLALMFDTVAIKQTLYEQKIDINTMPFGKLHQDEIMNAYGILRLLDKRLDELTRKSISRLSSKFYTLFPHISDRAQLNRRNIIKKKIKMIEEVLNLDVPLSVMKNGEDNEKDIFDRCYEKLKCKLTLIGEKSAYYEIIRTYLENTSDGKKLEIKNIFELRHEEKRRFRSDLSNRYLLWHGSRLINLPSILKQGLKILTGRQGSFEFHKGIYFADVADISAGYCMPDHAEESELILLLCEVALGNIKEVENPMHAEKPENGYDSIKGNGILIPNPEETVHKNGVSIPLGKLIEDESRSHSFNEYIVFDESQIRLKYLVHVKYTPKKK